MKQYRMLKEGEIIKKGDQYRNMARNSRWRKCRISIGDAVHFVGHFRRPIEEAARKQIKAGSVA